ncbi:MAG: prepilin peptidase [Puniceicoccales bacterium]|jgi:leader peptidase (prepilin peptidase)/N-methyltransferase|nr:prepilin peptidase [Puniceicoccales bacterium]
MIETLRTTNAYCPWLFTIFFGILGAIIGSFLNLCIHRLPRGESVVSPRSHCGCGTPIPWHLNIPVFSWFLLRGRAACCGRAFGLRHPLVETLTAVLFALCWTFLPWRMALSGMLFASWLTVLAFIDLDTMTLPDTPNLGLALSGLLLSAFLPELHGGAPSADLIPPVTAVFSSLRDAFLGILVGSGLLYWLRLIATVLAGREAMGEGDIILLGGIGAFCGWQGALFALFGGATLGAIVLIPILLIKKILARHDAEATARAASLASYEGDETAADSTTYRGLEVPFGPWLALGAFTWFLFFKKPLVQIFSLLVLPNTRG